VSLGLRGAYLRLSVSPRGRSRSRAIWSAVAGPFAHSQKSRRPQG